MIKRLSEYVLWLLVFGFFPVNLSADEASREELQKIAASLKIEPLSIDLCTLYIRYQAARLLERSVEKANTTGLKLFGVSPEEVKELREKSGIALARILTDKLRGYRWGFTQYPLECDYIRAGVNYNPFWARNQFRLVAEIRWLLKAEKLGYKFPHDTEIATLTEVDEAIEEFAKEQGPKLREQWLGKDEDKSEEAKHVLWDLVVEEFIKPSLLGLSLEEAGRLIEGLKAPQQKLVEPASKKK